MIVFRDQLWLVCEGNIYIIINDHCYYYYEITCTSKSWRVTEWCPLFWPCDIAPDQQEVCQGSNAGSQGWQEIQEQKEEAWPRPRCPQGEDPFYKNTHTRDLLFITFEAREPYLYVCVHLLATASFTQLNRTRNEGNVTLIVFQYTVLWVLLHCEWMTFRNTRRRRSLWRLTSRPSTSFMTHKVNTHVLVLIDGTHVVYSTSSPC